ncbi:peptidoglycan D,D-transpeptidase FtsI family protein [Floccifex sp.]|uniref:peptidoglycan D,D-transpeptidase FtsI family protein n=1 Tax=Floccifex sp. TaxID=2815810 RepID=UPI003F0402FC
MFKRKKRKMENKSINETITSRIIVLALVIFISFTAIIGRLFTIQVIQHDSYVEKKDDYTSIRQYVSAPRGQIYDRNGNVLAKTVVSHNITYTSPQNMSVDDYLLYAQRIVEVFGLDEDELTERDKKEAFITYRTLNYSYTDSKYAAKDLLTDKENEEYANGSWGANAESIRYGLLYNRIKEEHLKEMSDKDLKTCVIYQRMVANASTGQENVVLEDVDDDAVSYLVEHKTEFPGFEVDFGGWKREYPYGECLSDVLGNVSTSTEGLPEAYYSYYIQKGYQSNASVGTSGLEFQYNDLLAGTSEESIITYDSNGLAHKEVVRSAVKGYDIYLSIDIELQQTMDETVKSVLQEYAGTERRENFKSLFMCMMDPNDGSMLALSGYQIDLDTKELTYYASGNYTSLVNPGSSIKGATVYMGLMEGVIQPGEVIVDKTMNIAGEEFSSYEEHGPVDDIKALQVSSNVYMFNIAIRLAKGSYIEGEPLVVNDVPGTLNLMRKYYTSFGLGNLTGIDVPGEVAGYQSVNTLAGMLLNYSIGQYDMYTPIQLLEYVSTIASSGSTYKPRLYSYATEVNSNQVVEVYEKELRNRLTGDKSDEYLNRVQEGFRACVSSGNCGSELKEMEQGVAGKTGTAEVGEWTTAIFVGYAPYENPSVAFACAAPTSSINSQEVSKNLCTDTVTAKVLKKYFELYPQ